MIAAFCGPRRANFDAMENARGQSPACIAACTWESLVCNTAPCGRRLYTERARTSRRGRDIGGLEPQRSASCPFFSPVSAQARPRARLRAVAPCQPPHRGFIRGLIVKCSKYNNDINVIRRLRQPSRRPRKPPRFSALRSLKGAQACPPKRAARRRDGIRRTRRRQQYGWRSVG